jgi:hypothetical protein
MYQEEQPRKGKKRQSRRVFCEGKPEKGEHDWEEGVKPRWAPLRWEEATVWTQNHYIELYGDELAPRKWAERQAENEKSFAEREERRDMRWVERRCRKCGREDFKVVRTKAE